MRTAREIYETFKIMPALQLHQLRVAAVAKLICDSFTEPISTNDVVLAALFHDMGNILKFDLELFPEFLEPQGLMYWQQIKDDYLQKYGSDEHKATSAIVREINLTSSAVALIEGVGFSKMKDILALDSHYDLKIVEYGDCRATPYGITSIRERFEDGKKRYAKRHPSSADADAHYGALAEAGYGIEKQIFSHCSIKPEDINDVSAAPIIEKLWEYTIP